MVKGQQRDPKKEALWRSMLARFAKCGLSVRAFCRREKVTEPAFYAWRRVVQERDAERRQVQPPTAKRRATVPTFVPLVLRDDHVPVPDTKITVELRGGRVLRLPATIAPERLAELVRAVESVTSERQP